MKNFKKVISAVVALALSATTLVSAASFTDVAKTASYAEAIDVLSSLGIVSGYEDGTFGPEKNITRAETATMIVNALNMAADAENAKGTTQFSDVAADFWAAGTINVGVAQKFISGMGDGTFAPQANVTYAQMCTMLTTIAGYGDYAASQGGYPTGYTNMAATTGINKGVSVADNTALTRAQVAQMIYNTLTTPMLGVSEYSLAGNSYAQLDGKNNKAFKTLLADKFGGYVATAVINNTPVADPTLENNEVGLTVTKANWWYESNAAISKASEYVTYNKMAFVDGVDVNANILQVGKAVFTHDEDGELLLVYFAPTGKIETEEVEAADYIAQAKLADVNQYQKENTTVTPAVKANNKIRFGSKYYTLADSVAVYVNGKLATTITNVVDTAGTGVANLTTAQNDLDTYLGNALGTVKLVDNNDAATAKGYDAIMVDVWNIAKVLGVDYENGRTTVTMQPKSSLVAAYETIVIDDEKVEEGGTVVTVTKGGEESDLASLAKGDIIAYKSDIGAATDTKLENPKELEIQATNDTASGKFTSLDTDDETYTVDGTIYSAVVFGSVGATMTSGDLSESYTLTLDPFGRIYSAEKDGSATLYAVALSVSGSDDYLKLMLADGTTKSYAVESGATITGFGTGATIADIKTYLAAYDHDSDPTTAKIYRDASDRVVTYKVRNSTGEISMITLETPVPANDNWTVAKEYNGRTGRLGGVAIETDTPVLDARKAAADYSAASGYTTFSTENFKDGSKYKYVAFQSGKLTTLVVLNEVGTKINVDSRFAVVRKAPSTVETDDGDMVDSVVVLLDGEAEKELYFDTGVYSAHGLDIGDAFFYETNAHGYVSDVFTVLDAGTKTFTDLATALGSKSGYISTNAADDDAWTFNLLNSTKHDIQLVPGYVVPGEDGVITFAEIANPLTKIDTTKDHAAANDNGVAVFAVTEDTQAYMYNESNADIIKPYDKFSVKADTSVLASTGLAKYELDGVYDIANVSGATNMAADANYALAMIVNDVVVEIYVIK